MTIVSANYSLSAFTLLVKKIAITFLGLVWFQNFKDWQARDARALLLVLFLECYDARVRI